VIAPCRACGSAETTSFFEVTAVPVHSNLLYASPEEALGQKVGRLALEVCESCAFIQNSAWEPALVDYSASYEDGQGHSALFRTFADELVDHLVKTHSLRGRRILEVGCGQGDFLRRLCAAGGNTGLGFDPAYRGSPVEEVEGGRVEFRAELYGRAHADLAADFVFIRHTLEHIGDVRGFVGLLAANLPRGVPIYVEVPESLRILRESAFWDVYYEHASYFSRPSLETLLSGCGFRVERMRVGYQDQYLMAEAVAGEAARAHGATRPDEGVREVVREARDFGRRVSATLAEWSARLDRWRSRGARVVLWGAGSKAVGFLTALGGADRVSAIVDINPAKQGAFQAGTGHPIIAGSDLRRLRPGAVIVMNPIYRDEIGRELAHLGVEAEVCTL
jgi:SAM-dependent methyltransferase